ncbi:MAG: hypothetical protein UT63_C0008G0028 [Candidatus Gottesmanbacteria bacterium GW2011_GWC2_39_8]|uniref:Uncharacterized protein n=1 Tax=Candidatus Gottesmanbacteria bacterium GW2011_GWC2_39_8 TaxID=1618450 RepID=A0A0G0Q0Z8_9BACT|nr:MAG: hypothetical protein UT63_C0008G0028 [Candidatus Gottesmanbacteria bacterium GW2011_GWC2_39_8]
MIASFKETKINPNLGVSFPRSFDTVGEIAVGSNNLSVGLMVMEINIGPVTPVGEGTIVGKTKTDGTGDTPEMGVGEK